MLHVLDARGPVYYGFSEKVVREFVKLGHLLCGNRYWPGDWSLDHNVIEWILDFYESTLELQTAALWKSKI